MSRAWESAARVLRAGIVVFILTVASEAHGQAPQFTGQAVLASGPSSIVNLRGQGALTGTAPMNVQVTGVRVGGVLSPLINVLRAVLQPGAQASVCVEVQNLLGLDLTFLGVEMEVTAFNDDAPTGVSGRIRVQTGLGGEDTSPLACADAAILPPSANAGADQSVADTDQQPGENVTLDGSGSNDPDGTIVSYQWFNAANTQIATGATTTVRLPDGQQTLTLRVTDDSGATDVDTVSITVTAPSENQLPVARAGADRIVADTDSVPGENVALDGTASTDADGVIAQYEWLVGQSTVIATGPTPTVRLPDGPQAVTLRVTDDDGGTTTDTITITVAAANAGTAPTANAGPDRSIADSDTAPGETVTLDGSASSDADGAIVTYQWFLGNDLLGTGVSPTVVLPDGESFITLVVTDDDGNTASDGVVITVAAAPAPPVLALLPGLTPNQLSVAVAMDSMCPRLRARGAAQALTAGEADLLNRCNGIMFTSSTEQQVSALDEISPQDLNATRTQTLTLSRTQLGTIASRLDALRSGARGVSLAGLNLSIDGQFVPLAEVASSFAELLGGGASADDASDGLLDKRLGLWLRGNYATGSKQGTIADHGYESDQWGITGGVDFRFTPHYVVGLAFGYGNTRAGFSGNDTGYVDSRALNAALYATMYSPGGFYADAIVSYVKSDHDSLRRIQFSECGTPIDASARGGTSGGTFALAFTIGYDFAPGAFTIAPSVGYNYLNTGVDGFREYGAGGLDLRFDDQQFASATGSAGLRISYAWKTAVGVVQPHVRGEYIREFLQDTETFGASFANDPFDDTPRIIVTSDVRDPSYWRLTAGMSAQFTHGFSGFVEYQRLESLSYMTYADVVLGLRLETSFR